MRKSINQETRNLEAAERKAINANRRVKTKMTKEDADLKRLWIFGQITEAEYNSRLSNPIITTLRYSDEASVSVTGKAPSKHTMRKGINTLSDEKRQKLGLVITKVPGVEYKLMTDGTKICRCCQSRKPAKFFSNQQSQVDKKLVICKDCDSIGGKIRRADKVSKKVYI